MRLFFCLLFFLLSQIVVTGQPSYASRADTFIRSVKIKVDSEKDLNRLIDVIREELKTDAERVRAAYCWVLNNIQYDYEGLAANKPLSTVADAIKYKRVVCAGYARLLKYFCDRMSIECAYIIGDTKDIRTVFPQGHAWNAVMVDSQWRLIDATWADVIDTRGVQEHCYFADPNAFIYHHFPWKATWQLLGDSSVTKEEFSGWPVVSPQLSALGLSIRPFQNKIIVQERQPVEFIFTSEKRITKVYLSGATPYPIKEWSVTPVNGVYRVLYTPPSGTNTYYIGFGCEGRDKFYIPQGIGYTFEVIPLPDHGIMKGPSLPGK